jgi:HAD superfamily hydrolase (TIGR01509 family)
LAGAIVLVAPLSCAVLVFSCRLSGEAVLRAVIFDIDGTLIDSVDLHAESWVRTFANFGVHAKFEDVRHHIGEGADRLVPAFVPRDMPEARREEMENFRSALFKREYLSRVKPFPKVRELFGRIRADGCKIVLASSCTNDEIKQYKMIAGIDGMTDSDTTSDDAGSSKPSPDIFLKALERISPIRPEECCVVGDTNYDGEAARSAGVPFIGVLCGGSSQEDLDRAGAVAIYKDAADLLLNWETWRDQLSQHQLSPGNC